MRVFANSDLVAEYFVSFVAREFALGSDAIVIWAVNFAESWRVERGALADDAVWCLRYRPLAICFEAIFLAPFFLSHSMWKIGVKNEPAFLNRKSSRARPRDWSPNRSCSDRASWSGSRWSNPRRQIPALALRYIPFTRFWAAILTLEYFFNAEN